MRYRKRGSFVSTGARRTQYLLWDGKQLVLQPDASYNVLYGNSGRVDEISDHVTPNFRKVQAEGGIVNTPMSIAREERFADQSTFTGTHVTNGGSAQYSGAYLDVIRGGLLELPAIDTKLLNQLRTSASTSARAGVSNPAFQSQVFSIELLKTLKMIRKPMNGLVEYIRGYLKRRANPRYRGGTRGIPTVASCWLEYRYGWRPFLMEMEAGLKILLDGVRPPRQTSRATRERVVDKTIYVDKWTRSGTSWTIDFTTQHRVEYSVRSGILYEMQGGYQAELGARWSDIPATAWEVIPFSFVADWFVNVGDVINAFVPKAGVVTLAEFETVRVKRTAIQTARGIYGSSAEWNYTTPTGQCIRVLETLERFTKLPPAGFVLDTDLTEVFNASRLMDSLSLLIQLTGVAKGRRQYLDW